MKTKAPLVVGALALVAIALVATLVYGFLLAGGSAAPKPQPSQTEAPSPSQNPEVSSTPTTPSSTPTPQPSHTPPSRHPLIDAARAVDAAPFVSGEDAAFFAPGRKAYCQLDRGGVYCDLSYKIAFHSEREKRPCQVGELVNDGATLDEQGGQFGMCRSDTPLRDLCPKVDPASADAPECAKYEKTRVLPAGQRITLGDYTCATDSAGTVECISAEHGFRVGPAGYNTH